MSAGRHCRFARFPNWSVFSPYSRLVSANYTVLLVTLLVLEMVVTTGVGVVVAVVVAVEDAGIEPEHIYCIF